MCVTSAVVAANRSSRERPVGGVRSRGMIVDRTAAARRAEGERVREWLASQRVFISSAMADTSAERRAIASAIEDEGARAIWFEEFGRDADAEEAYLTEVDWSTIYIGILNEIYGRPNRPEGFSATEMEYERARKRGKRIHVLVREPAPAREGHLTRFIDRIQFYVTSESYSDIDDLARRVRRRLHDLANEELSPWVKLGDLVFRADEVDDREHSITIRTRASDEIAHHLELIRGDRYTRKRLRFTHAGRVRDGLVSALRRTTTAGGGDALTIELADVSAPSIDPLWGGVQGIQAEDLVEHALRTIFFGEALPPQLGVLEQMADSGIDGDNLREAFDLPNEIAQPITHLVVAEGLVGHGKARRITSLSVGPRDGDVRRLALGWEDATRYANVTPRQRHIEGEWRRRQPLPASATPHGR
jgi:hypothetical protein